MKYPELLTADKLPFETEQTYYWFDRLYERVECANWMDSQVREHQEIVYIQGSKLPVSWLRLSKNAAIADGQRIYRQKIIALQANVEALEKLKVKDEVATEKESTFQTVAV